MPQSNLCHQPHTSHLLERAYQEGEIGAECRCRALEFAVVHAGDAVDRDCVDYAAFVGKEAAGGTVGAAEDT